MPEWAVWAAVGLGVAVGLGCLVLLMQSVARDAARTIAAAYWAGQGDLERAHRALRGEKD